METSAQQLELFSGSGRTTETAGLSRNTFLGYIRGYEKIILIIMGFIVIAVVSFSLGVEKGRFLAPQAPAAKLDTASNIPTAGQKQEALIAKTKPLITNPAQAQEISSSKPGNYTIQLASFQSKNLAQKEAGALKKTGLTPLVISKGSYSVLCVGSFNSKETAKALLSQLRKKYQDSFIRRL
jgi:septal ring-binding cell division protein DamX